MDGRMPFFVKRLAKEVLLPRKGSRLAAGYDLHAAEAAVVPAEGKAIVKTGLAFKVPSNTYARIAPRSGLAAKNHIQVGAGVIDEDYRGEVCVVLFNHAKVDFAVKYPSSDLAKMTGSPKSSSRGSSRPS